MSGTKVGCKSGAYIEKISLVSENDCASEIFLIFFLNQIKKLINKNNNNKNKNKNIFFIFFCRDKIFFYIYINKNIKIKIKIFF